MNIFQLKKFSMQDDEAARSWMLSTADCFSFLGAFIIMLLFSLSCVYILLTTVRPCDMSLSARVSEE